MPRNPNAEEQHRAKDWVYRQFRLADDHRKAYQNKWDAWEKMYRGKVDTPSWWSAKDANWRSKIFVPMSFTIIETIIPRLIQGLFAERPFWEMHAKDRGSDSARIAAQEYMEFLIYQVMGFFKQLARGTKYAPKLGTAFFKVFSQPVLTHEWKVKGFWNKQLVRRQRVTMMPQMAPVSPYDLWIHPLAKDINGPGGAFSMMEKIRLTKRDFQMLKGVPGFFNLKAVEETSFPIKTEEEENASWDYRGLTQPGQEAKEDYVEIMEAHGYYDLKGNGNLEAVRIRLANRTVPISIQPVEDRWPYIRMRYGINENDIYGISALDPMEDLQDTVNTFVRQRLDNSTMLNWGMFKMKRGVDIGDAVVKPGKFFELNRMDDLEQLEIVDHTGGLMQDVDFLMMITDRVTGVNDYIRGTGAAGKQTAFEVGTLVQESHARFGLALKMIREETLTEMLDLIWDEAIQILPAKFDVRVLGKDAASFKKQSLSNIIGNFDWEIRIPPYQGNRMLMAQKLERAISVVGQLPHLVTGVDVLVRHLFEALEVPFPDDLVINPEDKAQTQMAAAEALVENEMAIADGAVAPPEPEENHAAHMKVHASAPEEAREGLADHIALHQTYMEQEQGGGQQAQPDELAEEMPDQSEMIRQDSIRQSPGTAGGLGGPAA